MEEKNKNKNLMLISISLILIISIAMSIYSFQEKKNSSLEISELNINLINLSSELILTKESLDISEDKLLKLNLKNKKLNEDLILIKTFEVYNIDYTKSFESSDELLEVINITEDYTTCIEYFNIVEGRQKKFNLDENKNLEFFKQLDENNSKLIIYKELIEKVKDSRKEFITKQKKWCYGWHKVEDSDSWNEKYWTPQNLITEENSQNEEKIYELELEIKKEILSSK